MTADAFDVTGTEYDVLDPLILRQLEDYVRGGRPPGGFVYAALCNDLAGTIARADRHSLRTLTVLVRFLTNRLPADCWGSEAAVERWLGHRGLSGLGRGHEVGCMCPACGDQSRRPRGQTLAEIFAAEDRRPS